jgi:hypothetical protein
MVVPTTPATAGTYLHVVERPAEGDVPGERDGFTDDPADPGI